MLGTMFAFYFIVPIAIIGLVAAALPMALMVTLIFAFALPLDLTVAIPITITVTITIPVTVAIPIPVAIPVPILVPASFPVSIVMSGGVASVTVLRKHGKASEGAGADRQNQGPCKLP